MRHSVGFTAWSLKQITVITDHARSKQIYRMGQLDDTGSPEPNCDLNKQSIVYSGSSGKIWIRSVYKTSPKFTEMNRERLFTEKRKLQSNMKKYDFRLGLKYKYLYLGAEKDQSSLKD